MQAGRLDRRIRIEQKSVTQDLTYGTEVITWATLVETWANVQDVLPSKTETLERNALVMGTGQTRVRIRYRSGIDSSMRVVLIGDTERVMQIVGGPAELGRKEGLEMMCESFTS